MAKIYISLMDTTASLEEPLRAALAAHEIKVNTANRTTPVDGGKSKMQEANEWPADLYLAVRTGKPGLSIKACGENTASKAWKISELAHDYLSELDPPIDNGVTGTTAIAEIMDTNMVSLYLIVGNAENAEDMAWYADNLDAIANAIASAVEEYLDADPETPDEPKDEPETPAETPETTYDESDAALGAALRTLIRAWRNE